MLKSVVGYLVSNTTNYGVTNMNNLYNFLIAIMNDMSDKQKQEMIDSLIIHLGKNFFKSFKKYMIEKIPESEHIKFMSRII